MSADGAAFGIIYPHGTRGTGTDAYMLELRGVPTRVTLRPGAILYTSGLGGTFPRGIVIGSVLQELKTAEVWTRTYLVRPAVTPSHVTTVLVLTAQRVTQGVGNVWGGAVNADSATRRIATAGDSIARLAAILEAKARAAALDSVKRAAIDSVKLALGVPEAPMSAADSAALKRTQATVVAPKEAAPVVRDTGALARRRPAAVASPPKPIVPRRDSTRRDTTAARRDSIRPDTISRKPRQ
jgi:rod shape-determining protein MreC